MSEYASVCVYVLYLLSECKKFGPLRELNPGPPAPEAGIMPLDQVATVIGLSIDASYLLSLPVMQFNCMSC